MAGELYGVQGNDHTWPILIQFRDDTDPQNPVYTPWDLDLYTFQCQIRSDIADKATTIAATMSVVATDAPAGKGNLILTSEDSENLAGKYKYEVVAIRTSDDYRTSIMSSTLTMKPRVTVVT